ncbi:hypothetical protein CR105_27265 [Massilia eurypsychrophila]|uniref:Collagen-like protein n=1 Tax=Massilia eurypsychrophila TaxID=1485217 RepID=A0A2G8T7B4_9BURK|nr:collagen-like protein [Massilia eurypsychrophila]PIL41892.1 hypothetical protein CR105_27265 [Massilia eurypsychrophila]
MKATAWSNSFYWVLRIFLGVAAALIVVAVIYPPQLVRGPAGATGAPGADGQDGQKGDKGQPGKDGDHGSKGNTGATGAKGSFWGGK